MHKFTVNDKSYDLPTSWAEVNLDKFIKVEAMNGMQQFINNDELGTIHILEILTGADYGEMDDITYEEMASLDDALSFVRSQPKGKFTEKLNIAGQIYICKTSMKEITLGEMASIKTYQEEAMDDKSKWLPQMMAILVRPARKVVKKVVEMHGNELVEVEKEMWVQAKLDASEIEARAELFLNHMSIEHVAPLTSFFFSTKNS